MQIDPPGGFLARSEKDIHDGGSATPDHAAKPENFATMKIERDIGKFFAQHELTDLQNPFLCAHTISHPKQGTVSSDHRPGDFGDGGFSDSEGPGNFSIS